MSRRVAMPLILLMFIAPLFGCESEQGAPATNSQTHWLRSCEADADCEGALACLCGVCTRACEANAACEGLEGEAVCASPEAAQASEACGEAGARLPAAGLCLPPPEEGEPEQLCGTRGAARCPEGQYCAWSEAAMCGAADQPGLCRATPAACDQAYDPVCGCDDQTYGNACAAAAAGVSVSSKGECGEVEPPEEVFCGGFGALACPEGQFCFYEADAVCGADDGGGVCRALPEVCPEVFAPVCGCDGQIYDSECVANGAGVSVAPEAWCQEPPEDVACGARAGDACAADEFCAYVEGELCGAADAESVCRPRPQECPQVILPVCGCDGQTYNNDCEANAAGVGVLSGGECALPGCLGDVDCPAGAYCRYPAGDACGLFLEQPGECARKPEGCEGEAAPVCGCDDQTYGNACEAAAAGVNVASQGACVGEARECGGFLGLECARGEFCDYALGDGCGIADALGACRAQPEVCTQEVAPVCGCDGQTYGNACMAAAAGVSVLAQGECR